MIRSGLASIESTATRITAIIDEQLRIVQVESDQALLPASEAHDLVALIRNRVAVWQEISDAHRLNFTTQLAVLAVECDPARLERALDNLLDNAIKYTPAGGDVSVTLAQKRSLNGQHATIEIEDEGIGIPSADLPYVFGAFYRARNTTTVIPGNGLGLASARALIEEQGGTLSITSTQNVGTSLTIRMPIQRQLRDTSFIPSPYGPQAPRSNNQCPTLSE